MSTFRAGQTKECRHTEQVRIEYVTLLSIQVCHSVHPISSFTPGLPVLVTFYLSRIRYAAHMRLGGLHGLILVYLQKLSLREFDGFTEEG